MLTYTFRRLLFAVPTLLVISFIIFIVLDLAPNDPTGNLPLTIPLEVRAKIRASLGLDEPMYIRYLLWLQQFFVNEPLNVLERLLGIEIGNSAERLRVLSWTTKSPVGDLIVERMPQTLWVVGLSYVFGILIAVPIGVVSAYRQYSWFDQVGTFVSMVGFSVPTFFTGLVLIVVFSVILGWLPSIYDTNHRVTDLASLWYQIKQMAMPVAVLAFYNAAQISRFMRASMLDNLQQDYVRTARAKGPRRAVRIAGPCAAQLADPGGHGDRARRAAGLRRGDHHRADFPRQRSRPATDQRHPECRHPARADPDLHLRGPDHPLQSGCRHPLRHAGSENPL